MSAFRWVALTGLALSLLPAGGCSFFPVNGPSSANIDAQSSPTVPYGLVKLSPEVVDVLAAFEPKGLAGTFTDRKPSSNIKFGIGDVVSVTIFEAAAGGLYIPLEAGVRPGNFVSLPDQVVDNDGNITVPYAGAIKAAGRTNVQIQNDIVTRIKNRAIEPQAVVALSQQRTSLISVIGEVNTPLRFAMPAAGAGDRILDAITRAGGIKGQGYESWVMLERDHKRATVPFENLVMNASNNIFVQPGDRIYVYREQQKFIAFGATGTQGQFAFDAWRINLAEGVAKAAGLVDQQADSTSVYLYRREPRSVAQRLGVDLSNIHDELVPVIFTVNLRDPGGYFLATRMQLRNQDILFVANAQSYEIDKFLSFVNHVALTAYSVESPIAGGAITRANLVGRAVVAP
ncbi:polysaccharide biosynthesis/export family protein [Beijerinckia mobilis]|uniref:polysaccharide biosynthesis/export family protein n=1 Tax=Beijerinckia mobilis TaxID=231434 RepID=UPI0005503464|nr:polysaccharide biosynthesis/export family protein [Beijerinckia mobilis]